MTSWIIVGWNHCYLGNLRVIEISRTATSGVVKFFRTSRWSTILLKHRATFSSIFGGGEREEIFVEGKMDGRSGIVKPGIIDDCLTPVTAVPPWNTCQPWWMRIDGRIHRYRWRRRPWAFIAADMEVFPCKLYIYLPSMATHKRAQFYRSIPTTRQSS